ncbi:YihY/virulence factor BrkB family protein [uncultured Fibrella sp.]|uniref:YihY/virulence factor BrkB family protein n=1 Tax=uncultured Fibrella sp. TaxID=1284596 RepID=UPI0035C9A7CB
MFKKLMSLKSLSGARVWLRTHNAFNSKKDWYSFLSKITEKITDNDLSERASSVAYSLILAIFPTVIFLFTLIPFIKFIPDLDKQIMQLFAQALPIGAFDTVDTTIKDIVSQPRGGVLSFGFILALYSATSGMVALMNAFNSAHETAERRSFLAKRGIAVLLTVALAISLFLAIGLLVVGGVVIDYLLKFGVFNNIVFYYLLKIARYLLVFAVFVGVVSVIYRYGPDVNMKWTFILPGSVAASVLIVLTTLGFSYYVSNFSSYNKVYGSIGTLIALMIWTNLVCLLLVLGYEMNVSLFDLEGDKNPSVARKTTNATSNM